MNKIRIDAMDKQMVYDYNICTIITESYKTKIKPNQVHTPSTAKLIVEDNGMIRAFLLKQPIITSDKNGEIVVMTTMLWDNATYNDVKPFTKDEIKEMRRMKKLLENKRNVGITFDEVFILKDIKADLDLKRLRKNILDENEGGGF